MGSNYSPDHDPTVVADWQFTYIVKFRAWVSKYIPPFYDDALIIELGENCHGQLSLGMQL